MKKSLAAISLLILGCSAAFADVSLLESKRVGRSLVAKSGDKKHVRVSNATGAQGLIDNSGLKYFINTDITFATTSSASGAMSEASYTHAVAATTSAGGTSSSSLNDAFDGYNTLCLSLNNSVANCATGNANFVIYNQNNAKATTECLGTASGVNRQVVLPVQIAGNISLQRKVFVPDNDSFARWLNYFTNTSGSPQTVTAVIANNLGSDSNTKITATSSGDLTATTGDNWVASFQNYSGSTSSDPRLGHVLQGAGAPVPLAGINFVDTDDNPFWGYTFTLAPGETKIIMNFVVGSPSKAAAAAKADQLSTPLSNASATQCMSQVDKSAVANFAPALSIGEVPTVSQFGLAALGLLLAAASLVILRRRA